MDKTITKEEGVHLTWELALELGGRSWTKAALAHFLS